MFIATYTHWCHTHAEAYAHLVRGGFLPKSSLFIVARIAAGTAYMALATGTGLARLAGGERRLRFARHASGRGLRWGWGLILGICRDREWICATSRIRYIRFNSPRCARYLAELRARADTSLSDSEPSVSYSVIGMWSVRIFLTSESVEPGLSDSKTV